MKEIRGREKDLRFGSYPVFEPAVFKLCLKKQLYHLLKTGFRSAICVLFLVFVIIQNLNAQQVKVFMAGTSKSNVTPPLGEILVGGYGAPVATHIHDELHARNLVLDDGNN